MVKTWFSASGWVCRVPTPQSVGGIEWAGTSAPLEAGNPRQPWCVAATPGAGVVLAELSSCVESVFPVTQPRALREPGFSGGSFAGFVLLGYLDGTLKMNSTV